MPRTTASACVLAPALLLTVTMEAGPQGQVEVHLHPGGQGYWISRMLTALGVDVRLCTTLAGETGTVLRALVPLDGITVDAVESEGSNGAYVHDRRTGDRRQLAAMPATPLSRHAVDALYERAISAGLEADVSVLGGPSDPGELPPDIYRRLAGDLRRNGRTVIADLSREPLAAALAGGVSVLKMSHEELQAEGRCGGLQRNQILSSMHHLAAEGADVVVITRAEESTLALVEGEVLEVTTPDLEPVDIRGGGDSVTAGISAALARGDDIRTALRLGGAAGALNVARRGLATGTRTAIEAAADHVTVEAIHEITR